MNPSWFMTHSVLTTPPNALQRTAAGRRGCHRRAPWPPSLSLGLAYRAFMNSGVDQTEDEQIDSRMPLWLAITANALSGGLALQFFWLSPSDWVRPIGWLFWTLASELNALFVLPLVLLNLKRLHGRTWPKYAVVLSLTAAPLGLLIEKIAHLV